ncbi:MAG: Zn-ribbon domain-containing OB-fold protein [Thaumarchaeota archaeon]|nr:Zn-ribbon domain-containing OB-fold protein [Nitrososphaerota archaeon]
MSSKIAKYEGTEITPEDLRRERYLMTTYHTSLSYAWSSGVATGKYLAGLKEGEIWGRRCNGCERTLVPPRMYCEQCFRATSSWVRLEDRGKVVTYSVSYVNSDASRRDQPIIVAVIEIAGGSPMMGILHLLGEVAPEKVRVSMEVEAVWKSQQDREGAITDIVYFRPRRKE